MKIKLDTCGSAKRKVAGLFAHSNKSFRFITSDIQAYLQKLICSQDKSCDTDLLSEKLKSLQIEGNGM